MLVGANVVRCTVIVMDDDENWTKFIGLKWNVMRVHNAICPERCDYTYGYVSSFSAHGKIGNFIVISSLRQGTDVLFIIYSRQSPWTRTLTMT